MITPYYQDTEHNLTLYHANALDVLSQLPDASVDLLITDPPYFKNANLDTLHLYGELAAAAARVCKPGSFVYTYVGTQFIPDVLALMTPHLDWFWLYTLRHGGSIPRMWHKKLMVSSKIVLAFTNGPFDRDTLRWSGTEHLSEGKDKTHHQWGQSIGFYHKQIMLRTQKGDVVLDPFVGGGPVPRACLDLGRGFIGCEIAEHQCARVKARLQQTVLPLEVDEISRQVEMLLDSETPEDAQGDSHDS